MNEDVTTISPTLGFIIKTVDFQGWHILLETYFPELTGEQLQAEYLSVCQWQSLNRP